MTYRFLTTARAHGIEYLTLNRPDVRNAFNEDVIAELVQVKGIGRWSVEMFLIFHLMRPDVLPVGDLGLAGR